MKVTGSPVKPIHGALEYLIDPRVGIIESLEEVPRQAGAPALFYFFAKCCDTRGFCRQPNFSDTGGASADREVAMGKAIGEAVERYCSAIFDMEELPLSSYSSAAFSCLAPKEFALYSKEQYESQGFPFVPFENETMVRWAPARDLVTGESRYVPASMVYVPYFYDQEHGVDVVTIGQYLQPSPKHATIDRWVHPDEFRWMREQGEALGFGSVFAGPLVRSSYRADEQRHAAETGRGAVAY